MLDYNYKECLAETVYDWLEKVGLCFAFFWDKNETLHLVWRKHLLFIRMYTFFYPHQFFLKCFSTEKGFSKSFPPNIFKHTKAFPLKRTLLSNATKEFREGNSYWQAIKLFLISTDTLFRKCSFSRDCLFLVVHAYFHAYFITLIRLRHLYV